MITPNKTQATSISSRIFSPFSYSLQRTKVNFQLQHLSLSKITQQHNLTVQGGSGFYATNAKNTRRLFQKLREGEQNSEFDIDKLIQQILEPQQPKHEDCTILNAMLFPRSQAYQVEQAKKPRQPRDYNQKNKKQQKADHHQELQFKLKNEQLTLQNRLLQDVLKPGVFLSIEQPLPDSVIEDYNRIKTNTRDKKQSCNIHFVQGYLTRIDYLYYVIENVVHLHQPRDPNNTHLQSTPTIRVIFEEIVYSILQTEITVDQLSFASKKTKNRAKNNLPSNYNKQTVLIFCHPYTIQLYCLAKYFHQNGKIKQNKPIGKLNVRYSLPNLSQPKHLHVSGSSILYMPDNSTYIFTHLCLITGQTRAIQVKSSISNSLLNTPNQNLLHNCYDNQAQPMKKSNHLLRNLYSNLFNHNHSTWVSKLINRFAVENQINQMAGCHSGQLIVCLIQIRVKQMFYNLMKFSQNQRQRKIVRVFVRQQFGQYACEDIYYNAGQEQILKIQFIKPKELNDDRICDNKCSCIIRIVIWSYATKVIIIRDYSANKESKNSFPIIGRQVCKVNCSGLVDGNKQSYTVALSQHIQSTTLEQLFVFAFFQNEKLILLRMALSYCKNNYSLKAPQSKQSKNMLKFPKFNDKKELILFIPVRNLKEKHLYLSNEGTITIASDHGYLRLNELRTTDCIYSTIYNQCLISQKQKQSSLFHLSQVLLSYIGECHLLMPLIYLISKMMAVCVGSISEKSHNNECKSTLLLLKYGKGSIVFKRIRYDINSSKTNESIRKICLNLLLYLIADFKNIISIINCSPQNFQQFVQQMCYDNRFIEQNPFANNKNTYFPAERQQYTICEHGKTGLTSQKNNSKIFDLKNIQNISNGIQKVGFCLTVTNLIFQIWNQPITYLSVDKVRKTLQKLDSLRDICIAIGRSGFQQIAKQDTSWSHNKKLILSPTSTVAHSSMQDSQKLRSQKLSFPVVQTKNSLIQCQQWINRVTQLIICSQIIKDHLQKSNSSITFRQLYFQTKTNSIGNQIEDSLFNQFVNDFDPGLLKQWDKLIPSFLTSQSIILQTKCKNLIEIKPLRFWLNIFTQICGITNKLKILKVLSEHLSKFKIVKWPANQLFDYEQLEFQLRKDSDCLKLNCEKKLLPIPMFFINYLSKQKRIQFCDFHLLTSDLSSSSSKYSYTNSYFPYSKSTQPFQSDQRTFSHEGKQQVLQVQNFEVKESKGQNLNEQIKQDLQFSKIILPKAESCQKKNKASEEMQRVQQDAKNFGLQLEQVIKKTAYSLNQ